MGLIKCPECQHDVSDKAAACPKCGYPIAAYTQSAQPQTESNKYVFSLRKNSKLQNLSLTNQKAIC